MEDGPRQRKEYKATTYWAWPGARDEISKFWDPLITFERKSYLLEIWYIYRGRNLSANGS